MKSDLTQSLTGLVSLALALGWASSVLAAPYPPQPYYQGNPHPQQQPPPPPRYPQQQRPPQFNPAMGPNRAYRGPAP
ncbi:MAG TPA: hypothetical protein ENJ84_14815, partial [Gammaproteobacteria bacterium]|nr:hypothetical protein [Gammaproteobacteria bacterium]